jgi:hypothetical protein
MFSVTLFFCIFAVPEWTLRSVGNAVIPFGTPRSFWNAVLSTLGTQRSEATPELSGP